MAKTKRRFKEVPKWRTKQSLRNKRRRKARQVKEEKRKRKNFRSFAAFLVRQRDLVSYPNEGDAKLCKSRVASGMKCWCQERCDCRRCQERKREDGRALCPSYCWECPEACKKCSNYKPCWK